MRSGSSRRRGRPPYCPPGCLPRAPPFAGNLLAGCLAWAVASRRTPRRFFLGATAWVMLATRSAAFSPLPPPSRPRSVPALPRSWSPPKNPLLTRTPWRYDLGVDPRPSILLIASAWRRPASVGGCGRGVRDRFDGLRGVLCNLHIPDLGGTSNGAERLAGPKLRDSLVIHSSVICM